MPRVSAAPCAGWVRSGVRGWSTPRCGCGGLGQARALAGVPTPRTARRQTTQWSRAGILDEVRGLAARGEGLNRQVVDARLYQAATRHFGSWQQAIAASGLEYAEVRRRRPPDTPEELLHLLRVMAERHPAVSLDEVRRHHTGTSILDRFGAIEAAVLAAGISGWPSRRRGLLRDEDEHPSKPCESRCTGPLPRARAASPREWCPGARRLPPLRARGRRRSIASRGCPPRWATRTRQDKTGRPGAATPSGHSRLE
jgi:hypothetical protein